MDAQHAAWRVFRSFLEVLCGVSDVIMEAVERPCSDTLEKRRGTLLAHSGTKSDRN